MIVSYGRYIEERQQGATLEDGPARHVRLRPAAACWSGALTTTATFYAFIFTHFTGLRQMGLLTGTGILFCALASSCCCRRMLAWSEDRHSARRPSPSSTCTALAQPA